MIQDLEVQDLWSAVEEIRRRVESLESSATEEKIELPYVASATSNRKTFHLRGCKFTRGFMKVKGGYTAYCTREEAVSAGYVPCKNCFG
jgi:hypothetical protein